MASGIIRSIGRRHTPRILPTILHFIDLNRAIILRNVALNVKIRPFKVIDIAFIMAVIVALHAVLFEFVDRGFPGQISLLSAALGGFFNWTCFLRVKNRSASHNASLIYNRAVNINWLILFSADVIWDLLRITTGAAALLIVSRWYFPFNLVAPLVFPNIPRLAEVALAAAILGAGVGLTMDFLEHRWPIFSAFDHIITWLLFFSCGIYGSYVQQPSFLAHIVQYNPLLVTTEFARSAFDPTYPLSNLSVSYAFVLGLFLLAIGLATRSQKEK